MIRQLIIVLFASYMVCMGADDEDKSGKIGAILDQICAQRAGGATANRIEKEKASGDVEEENTDDVEEPEDHKSEINTNTNINANRKMYYSAGRRFIGDESAGASDENNNRNSNINLNFNTKRRTRSAYHQRRSNADEPNRDSHRRMMNGLRRKLSRY